MAPATNIRDRFAGPPTPSASQSGTGRMSPFTSTSTARQVGGQQASRERPSSQLLPEETVRQLFETFKLMLDSVGQTIDVVGETTEHVAGLSPAMEMVKQAGEVGKDVEKLENRQKEQMEKLQEYIKTMAKENVQGVLAQAVEEIVKEEIQKQIAQKVAEQLRTQISVTLKRQAQEHDEELTRARVRLNNTEARRVNSIPKLHTSEPLRPFLRPNGRPSAHFPQDIATLLDMPAADVKQLLRDFELHTAESSVSGEASHGRGHGHGHTPRIVISDEEEYRVTNLNRFLKYIGIGFEVLPARPTAGYQSAVPPSPIFVQSH